MLLLTSSLQLLAPRNWNEDLTSHILSNIGRVRVESTRYKLCNWITPPSRRRRRPRTMTERWVSTKKHYCKYCNTWIPDTKISRQQHDISDRHKNAMQRNLSRIQRNDLINRHSAPSPATSSRPTAGASSTNMRRGVINTAAYGYGDRDDMAAYIAQGKKIKFDNLNSSNDDVASLPKSVRETNVGKWEVTQIISKEQQDEGRRNDGVKKEESSEPHPREENLLTGGRTSEGGKRERARTPDEEDLFRFRVQEKVFPTEVKEEEGYDIKVPAVGFKKRKVGWKSSRVSGAL